MLPGDPVVGRESWRRFASNDWRLLRFAEDEKVELWREFMFWQNSHQIIGSLWFFLSYLLSFLHRSSTAAPLQQHYDTDRISVNGTLLLAPQGVSSF